MTRDTSSTFRDGKGENHAGLARYALGGAVSSFVDMIRNLASVVRLFRVTDRGLLDLASRHPVVRNRELTQIRLDRSAHLGFVILLATLSWQWVLLCYLPSMIAALALVNVQNYYRHYGAEPDSRYANSVSHYGRLYNLLTFNDGYHQEHHLRPTTHWLRLPEVAVTYREEFDRAGRVVSPVPAIVGFLDRGRAGAGTLPSYGSDAR